jgi:hypothetical protein
MNRRFGAHNLGFGGLPNGALSRFLSVGVVTGLVGIVADRSNR